MVSQIKRIGLIVPSLNTAVEAEFNRYAPPGMSFHATRVSLPSGTYDELREMAAQLPQTAGLLAALVPDVVVYACNSGSMLLDGDPSLRKLAAAALPCKFLTLAEITLESLSALGVSSVSLGTPYDDAVTEAIVEFLERHGTHVVRHRSLRRSGLGVREIGDAEVMDLAKSVDDPAADAVLLSCTDLRTAGSLHSITQTIGKPVLSSNQLLLWGTLAVLGLENGPAGLSRLREGKFGSGPAPGSSG